MHANRLFSNDLQWIQLLEDSYYVATHMLKGKLLNFRSLYSRESKNPYVFKPWSVIEKIV